MIAAYFDAEPYGPAMFTAQAVLASQPALMKEAVESLPNPDVPAEELLDEYDRIVTALQQIANPSITIEAFRAIYDAGTLKSLRFASRVLHGAQLAHADPASALKDVREAAEQLRRLIVEDTALDPSIRRFLFGHVDAIMRALDLWKIGGADLVLGEWDRLRGHAHRDKSLFVRIVGNPKVRQAVALLAQTLAALNGVYDTSLAIGSGLDQLLSIDPPTVEAPAPDSGSVA